MSHQGIAVNGHTCPECGDTTRCLGENGSCENGGLCEDCRNLRIERMRERRREEDPFYE